MPEGCDEFIKKFDQKLEYRGYQWEDSLNVPDANLHLKGTDLPDDDECETLDYVLGTWCFFPPTASYIKLLKGRLIIAS